MVVAMSDLCALINPPRVPDTEGLDPGCGTGIPELRSGIRGHLKDLVLKGMQG